MISRVKVFVLMAGLTALLGVVGGAVGGTNGAILFLILAGFMNFGMYWWSDKVVLRMYRARVVDRQEAPALFDMVDRLRRRADLPMPTVAIVPSEQPNAFATGRNHKHAVVAVTSGLMQLVDQGEIEGVLAHELAHVKHRHMLIGTLAATVAGAIAIVASVARWGFILGGRRSGGNPIVMLAVAILAPVAAMVIQFAISRQNEFQADRSGAEIAGNPRGLANALRKLDAYSRRIPMEVNPAAAQLCIVNPLNAAQGGGMLRLFSTHPSTEDRISRLEAMKTGSRR